MPGTKKTDPPAGGAEDMEGIMEAVAQYRQAKLRGQVEADPQIDAIWELMQKAQAEGVLGQDFKLPSSAREPAPQAEAEEITPEPGFVVKTADEERGAKVFINVCGSDKVAAPGDWKNGVPKEVEEAMGELDGDPNMPTSTSIDETLRFPLSLSDPFTSTDKGGAECTVYDIVLNSEVVKNAKLPGPLARRLKTFLVELCMGWVAHKHGVRLDPKYKLPRSSYKGDGRAKHRIRAETKPLIQEVAGSDDDRPSFGLGFDQKARAKPVAPRTDAASEPSRPGSTAQAEASLPTPDFSVEYEGRPVEATTVTVNLPAISTADGLRVELAAGELRVHVPSIYAPATIPLHFPTDPKRVEVTFDESKRQLRIRLPFGPYRDLFKELKRAAPHSLASLDFRTKKSVLDIDI
ncbi:hypothetical protein KFL_001010230 [Klebsormidium nitens]|uniref:PIH1 N-terminal domain-containing protein n=1 Tax=Klebsormidium nitens TaxID=105231 RepID=A0A1Y1I1Y4_KLENI|nr:hypothetical protein KFL_001010230 [Klebsormidium nitens]|eukprot:GAQ82138.1 hypothetical protein KFL_001010230 [Klebsormidium nitens]